MLQILLHYLYKIDVSSITKKIIMIFIYYFDIDYYQINL